MSCPKCGTIRDVELIEREENVTIQGREVVFRAHFYCCTTCGEEFEAPGQLDGNLSAAREAYARAYESPATSDLIALRGKYGASQKAFGLILGFGELTMNNYEQGAKPDSTNRLILKLAEHPVLFKAMYQLNSLRIGAIQRKRIETSDAFRSAVGWAGLESLAVALTPLQQSKVETCAAGNKCSILQQVAAYVNAACLQDQTHEAAFLSAGGSSPK
jgi:putative zinc finger/helix-turn-helix YgiT family protein